VGRGPLPGGPRPRFGIEKFFDASHMSQSIKRFQVLIVELELPLHRLRKKFQSDISCHFPKISGFT